jgi:hypothetical protein
LPSAWLLNRSLIGFNVAYHIRKGDNFIAAYDRTYGAYGKLGNFAIAEVGDEANYTVKLKWKNKSKEKPEV